MTQENIMSRLPAFTIIPPSKWLFQDLGLIGGKAIIANEYKKINKSFKNAEYKIEEFIRQWIIQQLVETYNYPETWMGDLIVVEEPVHIGSNRCRVDVAIINRNGEPIVLIETKSASCSGSELRHAEQQLKSYLSATHTAIYGVLTTGINTTFLKKKINPNTFEVISDLPTFSDMVVGELFTQRDIDEITVQTATHEAENDEYTESIQEIDELVYPSVEEYVRGFQSIERYLSENQREMLRTHYYASQQTVTMTELAQSVGYKNYRGGNLHYGKIGKLLCAELDWAYGVGINILVWFTHPSNSPNGQWLLTLHKEVAEALEKLKWV